MAQTQISRRHHYLPQFLLKAFSMDNGKLWVYDKSTAKFWKEPASPKQIFWRHNRNTFKIGDEETDFVETIFSKIDDDFAPLHADIIKRSGAVSFSVEEIVQLIKFITISYYRIPLNDQFIEDYVSNRIPQKLGFRLVDKNEPMQNVGKDVYSAFVKEPAFIESYRISKALLELLAYSENLVISEWNIASPVDLNGVGLIGDNPVILREDFSGHVSLHELIMPISKHHLVYHIRNQKNVELPPVHKLKVDLCQILQAEKYVCGSNLGYMKKLIEFIDSPENRISIQRVKNDLFNDFKD